MKTIRLNKHLSAVSGKTVEDVLRAINMADVEEGGDLKSCIEIRIENINEVNAANDKEIQGCITTAEESSKANNANYSVARRGIDDITKSIIQTLEKCLELEDHFESTKCTSKYDSVNNDLTDNSGLALKVLENMISENANIRAERDYCVDKSLRTAKKRIGEEQKGIQICLDSKQL